MTLEELKQAQANAKKPALIQTACNQLVEEFSKASFIQGLENAFKESGLEVERREMEFKSWEDEELNSIVSFHFPGTTQTLELYNLEICWKSEKQPLRFVYDHSFLDVDNAPRLYYEKPCSEILTLSAVELSALTFVVPVEIHYWDQGWKKSYVTWQNTADDSKVIKAAVDLLDNKVVEEFARQELSGRLGESTKISKKWSFKRLFGFGQN